MTKKLTVDLFEDGTEVYIMESNKITLAHVKGFRVTGFSEDSGLLQKEYFLDVEYADCTGERWMPAAEVFENRETLIAQL
jgi:hypothetical protein